MYMRSQVASWKVPDSVTATRFKLPLLYHSTKSKFANTIVYEDMQEG